MDEADYSVHQAQARAMAVIAQQRAIKATKRAFQAQGLKPHHMVHRIIVAAAGEYLSKHRAELINEAKEIVDRWQAEGMFGKRGGIRRTHRATLNTHAQRAKA